MYLWLNDVDQSWCAGNVFRVCRDSDRFSPKGSWAGPVAHRDVRLTIFLHKCPLGVSPVCHINAIFHVLHNTKKFRKLEFRPSLPEVEVDDYSIRIQDILNSPSCFLMKINDENNNCKSFFFFFAALHSFQDLGSLTRD